MSNSILNYHILDGQPAGEDADLYEIADYYGDLLFMIRPRDMNNSLLGSHQSDKEEKEEDEN